MMGQSHLTPSQPSDGHGPSRMYSNFSEKFCSLLDSILNVFSSLIYTTKYHLDPDFVIIHHLSFIVALDVLSRIYNNRPELIRAIKVETH